MMTAGGEAKQLDVEHVGEPGEGEPVGPVGRGKGPADAFGGETGTDVRVGGDVVRVVVVDEVVPKNGGVEGDCQQEEEQRNEKALRHTVPQYSEGPLSCRT